MNTPTFLRKNQVDAFFPFIFLVLAWLSFFSFCKNVNQISPNLEDLEKKYIADPSERTLQPWIAGLQKASESSKDPQLALNFSAKSAMLQFDKTEEKAPAARFFLKTLESSKATDKVQAYGQLAYMYAAFVRESKTPVDPHFADSIAAVLLKQTDLVEKARLQLKKEMVDSVMQLIPAKTDQFIRTSEGLAEVLYASNPNKSLALDLESGHAAKGMRNFKKAIALYHSVSERHPKHELVPEALFLVAFTYDNDLGDFENARKNYSLLIQNFPNSQYAKDAQELIKVLGVPIEEVVEKLQKNK